MSYRDHNERALRSYDRWLTTPPEPPEEAYHKPCDGEGCEGCDGTGLDPVKMAEYEAAQREENDALYEAYLESRGAGNEEID